MKLDVRIDSMVLEGLELSRWEREALSPAIARELRVLEGAATGDGDRREAGSTVDGIAREVALAVHEAIGPARARQGARG